MKRLACMLLCAAVAMAAVVHLASAQAISVPADKGVILVTLPASATLKIGDTDTKQIGTFRVFTTPELEAGFTYSYLLVATFKDGNVDKTVARTIDVSRGKATNVNLNEPGQAAKAETKKETKKPVETTKTEPKKVEAKEETKKEEPKAKQGELIARSFLFTYGGTVKDLSPGQEAHIWLPMPQSTQEQQVSVASKKLPGKDTVGQEKQYGNKSIYFIARADQDGKIPFEVVYKVKRSEVKTDMKANLTLKPRPEEKLVRFLEPDKLVPITGKPLELIKDKKLPSDQFKAAKEMYDVVNTHMKYDKSGKGWGRGDAEWACDSKFGNCTDFHSLFISMARGNKIPSKFEMGFSVPEKRGGGPIGGYHCWAWFLPNGKGWIPVDISEANRFPGMKDYYFGNLTEDRVQFTTGRDIDLEPRQKGPALNFFIYPYVEVNGQSYPLDKIDRAFAYQDAK